MTWRKERPIHCLWLNLSKNICLLSSRTDNWSHPWWSSPPGNQSPGDKVFPDHMHRHKSSAHPDRTRTHLAHLLCSHLPSRKEDRDENNWKHIDIAHRPTLRPIYSSNRPGRPHHRSWNTRNRPYGGYKSHSNNHSHRYIVPQNTLLPARSSRPNPEEVWCLP